MNHAVDVTSHSEARIGKDRTFDLEHLVDIARQSLGSEVLSQGLVHLQRLGLGGADVDAEFDRQLVMANEKPFQVSLRRVGISEYERLDPVHA